jgi:hypothetical protein
MKTSKQFKFIFGCLLALLGVAWFLSGDASVGFSGFGVAVATAPIAIAEDRSRSALSRVTAMVKKRFPTAKNPIIAPSFLRADTEVVNNKSVFDFFLTVRGNENVAETKLDRNDVFYATHLGFFLTAVVSAVPGIAVLNTYPNPTTFATDGSNFISTHLEVLYNGFFSVKIGSVQFVERLDSNQFRYVPTAQQGTVTSETITTANAIVQSKQLNTQYDGGRDGIRPITPYIIFSGAEQNEIKLTIPGDTSLKIANTNANTKNWMVFKPYGFVVKNVNVR